MDKSENEKKYALIAAICYAAIAIYSIIYRITDVNKKPEYASITVVDILNRVIFIGFAVVLFIKNKKALLAVAGAYTVLNIYFLIQYFSLFNSFYCLAYAALIIIIILALNSNISATKLWFVAAVLLFLGRLITWITDGYFSYLYLSAVWESMLVSIIECVALMFSGMWIKDDLSPAETTQTNEYATFNPQAMGGTQAKTDAIGGADKLKMYKELLDSGTITQEEFDQKKKQILGL